MSDSTARNAYTITLSIDDTKPVVLLIYKSLPPENIKQIISETVTKLLERLNKQ